MSGHSKWAQIKRQKQSADQKRGNLFTKFANAITIAAREGSADPESNFKLRLAIERARAANVPNDNIERAIQRSAGKTGAANIETTHYEGFGPGGAAFIVEVLTDNKNRTTAEIRNIFTGHGGRLADQGSVLWMFQKKGVLRISEEHIPKEVRENFELKLIDAGADDILNEPEGMVVFCPAEKLHDVKHIIEQLNIAIASAELEFVPKEKLAVDSEDVRLMLEALSRDIEDHPDVNDYFSNVEI